MFVLVLSYAAINEIMTDTTEKKSGKSFLSSTYKKGSLICIGCLISITLNLSVIVVLLVVIVIFVVLLIIVVIVVFLIVIVLVVVIVIEVVVHEIHLLIITSIVCLRLGKLYFKRI